MNQTNAIVGAAFRPPAKQILAELPSDHPLILRREPSNPYDENAIQVLVAMDSLTPAIWEELEPHLVGYGLTKDDLEAQPFRHLGYVPKVDAVLLAPGMDRKAMVQGLSPNQTFWLGKVAFSPRGATVVDWDPEIMSQDPNPFGED